MATVGDSTLHRRLRGAHGPLSRGLLSAQRRADNDDVRLDPDDITCRYSCGGLVAAWQLRQAIAGKSHYQGVLQNLKRDAFIAVGDTPIATFLLAREPDNPHDRDTIAVLTDGGDVVRYLSPSPVDTISFGVVELVDCRLRERDNGLADEANE